MKLTIDESLKLAAIRAKLRQQDPEKWEEMKEDAKAYPENEEEDG